MKDPLIEKLVSDLKPVKPMMIRFLWFVALACLSLAVLAVLGAMGVREDYSQAIEDGAMFWKPGIFLLLALGGLLLIGDLSRPQSQVRAYHIVVPAGVVLGLLGWQMAEQWPEIGTLTGLVTGIRQPYAAVCCGTITIGGLLILAGLWYLWLRKTASSKPAVLGAVSGMTAGGIMAASYAMHCSIDSLSYVGVYYVISIAVLGVIGYFIGRRYLQW